MIDVAHSDASLAAVVESAVRQLVSVSSWGNSSFVSLPLFYPGGGAVSIKIEIWSASEFRVSDNGFAYREVESLGAERSFPKTAGRIAVEQGVSANRRLIYAEATVGQLAMKIAKRSTLEEIGRRRGRSSPKMSAWGRHSFDGGSWSSPSWWWQRRGWWPMARLSVD